MNDLADLADITSGHGFVAAPEVFTDYSVSDLVRHWARTRGAEPAYISRARVTTWAE